MAKISVIIPVYNAEAFLEQTLNSVLNQSLKDIEVICVDDGSTDHSLKILNEFVQKDPRVMVARQQNMYAGAARNKGIEMASGEYIHFLDADDYVLDYAYESIYNTAVKYDLDCLKFRGIGLNMETGHFMNMKDCTLDFLPNSAFLRYLKAEPGSILYQLSNTVWTGIFRRSFLLKNKIRFNNLFCVNDRSFTNHVYLKAEKIMISRDLLVVYRNKMKTSLIGRRSEHFDCVWRSVQIVKEILDKEHTDKDLYDFIMNNELSNLLFWCSRYAAENPVPNAQDILKQTYDYLVSLPKEMQKNYLDRWHEIEEESRKAKVIEEQAAPVRIYELFIDPCEEPSVSVIIPVGENSLFAEETMYSLSRQPMKEAEYLFVTNDVSGKAELLFEKYHVFDRRFRLLQTEESYGGMVNLGLREAAGKYVTILDAGMYIRPETLKELYDRCEQNRLDVLQSDSMIEECRDHKAWISYRKAITEDRSYHNTVFSKDRNPEILPLLWDHTAAFYRTAFLRENALCMNEGPYSAYLRSAFTAEVYRHAERSWISNKPYFTSCLVNDHQSLKYEGLQIHEVYDDLYRKEDEDAYQQVINRMIELDCRRTWNRLDDAGRKQLNEPLDKEPELLLSIILDLKENDIDIEDILTDCSCGFELICLNADKRKKELQAYRNDRIRFIEPEKAGGRYVYMPGSGFRPEVLTVRHLCQLAEEKTEDVVLLRTGADLVSTTSHPELLPEKDPFTLEDIRMHDLRAFSAGTGDKLFRTDFLREKKIRFRDRQERPAYFTYRSLLEAGSVSVSDVNVNIISEQDQKEIFNDLEELLKEYPEQERVIRNLELMEVCAVMDHASVDEMKKTHDAVVNRWLKKMHPDKHDEWYYFDRNEYRKAGLLHTVSLAEYLKDLEQEKTAKIMDLLDTLKEKDIKIEDLLRRVNSLNTTIGRRNDKIKDQDHRIALRDENISKLRDERERHKTKISEQNEQIRKLKTQLQEEIDKNPVNKAKKLIKKIK